MMAIRSWLIISVLSTIGALPLAAVDHPVDATMLLDQRVSMLGDSITQAGGYVTFLEYYLTKGYPKHEVDIIGVGLSSETTSGLTEKVHPGPRPCIFTRLDALLSQEQPKVVIACYGMNDGIYLPLNDERMQAFQKGIGKLIATVKDSGARLVLVTPPAFDVTRLGGNVSQDDTGPGYTKPYVKYDEVLAAFAAWETKVHEQGVRTIDLHTPMAAYLASRRAKDPNFFMSGDSIHPGDLGHLLMARVILQGLGMKLGETDLDQELQRVQQDPLYELVKRHREMRSQAWLPYSRGGSKQPVDQEELDAQALIKQIEAARQAR